LSRRATERLQALQREADQLASEERTLLNDLRKLEVERQIKAEELRRITADMDRAADELADTNRRIAQLETENASQEPALRARLVEIYKRGRMPYVRLLVSTADVRQIGRASRMAAALVRVERERLAVHQQTVESLKTARSELEAKTERLRSTRRDTERA